MLGTVFRVVFGFLLACLAAGLVKVGFVIPPTELIALPENRLMEEVTSAAELVVFAATHSAVFAAPFALVAIALSEWLGVRSIFYHLLAAVLITMAGFLSLHLSEPGAGPTIVNTYAMTAYPVAGIVAGLVYWLVAGRGAGGVDQFPEEPMSQPPAGPLANARPPVQPAGSGSVPPAGRA